LAIVSLSAQTGESASAEDESSLLFVRKFILESALKAFKDASSSLEPLDAKYSRMMSLTDLFFQNSVCAAQSQPFTGQCSF